MVHDRFATGGGEHQGAETEEGAGRNLEFHVNPAAGAGLGIHRTEFATTTEDEGHHVTLRGFRAVDRQGFDWLALDAINLLHDDGGLTHGEFEAFAAHRFDEDAQVHEATAGHLPRVIPRDAVDAEGDVLFEFLDEALADLAAGDELSVATSKRRIVDAEGHGHSGLVDTDRSHGTGVLKVGDGLFSKTTPLTQTTCLFRSILTL